MTQFLRDEVAGLYLYLLVLNIFVLGLVFWISRSVYIPLFLLIQLDSELVAPVYSVRVDNNLLPKASQSLAQ